MSQRIACGTGPALTEPPRSWSCQETKPSTCWRACSLIPSTFSGSLPPPAWAGGNRAPGPPTGPPRPPAEKVTPKGSGVAHSPGDKQGVSKGRCLSGMVLSDSEIFQPLSVFIKTLRFEALPLQFLESSEADGFSTFLPGAWLGL